MLVAACRCAVLGARISGKGGVTPPCFPGARCHQRSPDSPTTGVTVVRARWRPCRGQMMSGKPANSSNPGSLNAHRAPMIPALTAAAPCAAASQPGSWAPSVRQAYAALRLATDSRQQHHSCNQSVACPLRGPGSTAFRPAHSILAGHLKVESPAQAALRTARDPRRFDDEAGAPPACPAAPGSHQPCLLRLSFRPWSVFSDGRLPGSAAAITQASAAKQPGGPKVILQAALLHAHLVHLLLDRGLL